MSRPQFSILLICFFSLGLLGAGQSEFENPSTLPPKVPKLRPPPKSVQESDRQRERADLVVEYHPEKGFSLVKPFRDPHDLVKEADLPKFLASKRIRRNLVIVTFGKLTLLGKSKPERDQVFEQLAAQFRKLGFRKIIFQQEAGNGPYQIGERTF